ncbi:E3 ubiquitin-protein ligase Midline-1 isoform X2 [Chelonus insularis]|uniref:E3 ubiquitin-protein ligase Midline-1 isoform X2 n=1 Tax=Chelonus insularis TaxID=460826 RepID=UPI00158F1E39|nr:E3 ubiquitin-protein ligase Midline-1 isoform X2 [Chelonus insularis]
MSQSGTTRLATMDSGSLESSWAIPSQRGCPICDYPLPTSKSPTPPPHYPLQHRLLMNAIITRQLLCYCDTCNNQQEASLHCSTCLRNFCLTCGTKHHQTRGVRSGIHKVCPLYQAKRFRRTTVCLKHPVHPVRFYCIACQQVACCECMWGGEHRGHASEEHTVAGKTISSLLANVIRNAKNLLDRLLLRYTLNSFSSSYSCRSNHSTQPNPQHWQDKEDSLYTKEARQRIEEFNRLKNARYLLDAISFTEQLLAEGSYAEILSLAKIILKRFQMLGLNNRLDNSYRNHNHTGVFHCCSFCSSGGKKEATCACGRTMPGGYRGCGHGHPGHLHVKHWSCCGSTDPNSICSQQGPQRPIYRFRL